MKVLGIIYFKNGITIEEKSEGKIDIIKNMLSDELINSYNSAIEEVEDNILNPCFKNNTNGYLKFGKLNINLSEVMAIKFDIIED